MSAAQSINLDETVSGDFGEGKRETDLYRFSGSEGERIFLNIINGGKYYSSNIAQLYTNEGVNINVQSLQYYGQDRDYELNFPYTGEYIVISIPARS